MSQMNDAPTPCPEHEMKEVHHESTANMKKVVNARDYLFGSKGFLSSPDSLSRLMTSRGLRSAACLAIVKKTEKRKEGESANVDYGYGDDYVAPPQPKRRRFQRRNSKTPAMLMAMSASIAMDELAKECGGQLDDINDDKESWDGGLKVAEELVQHLHARRRVVSRGV